MINASDVYYHSTEDYMLKNEGIKRWAELVVAFHIPVKYAQKIEIYRVNNPIRLKYTYNDLVYEVFNSALHSINYTILNDNVLSESNLRYPLVNDLKLISLELESPDYGLKVIPVENIVSCIGRRRFKVEIHPEIQIHKISEDNTHTAMYAPNGFSDLKFLTNPSILSSGKYSIAGFGYHRAYSMDLSVDSVLLRDKSTGNLTYSNFVEPLIVGKVKTYDK